MHQCKTLPSRTVRPKHHFTNASSSAILASSSATAGVFGAATAMPEPDLTSSVTHPSLAVATHWMYLNRVPLLARRGGGLQAFLRSSHSSSEIRRSMVRASGRASMRMGSPFFGFYLYFRKRTWLHSIEKKTG